MPILWQELKSTSEFRKHFFSDFEEPETKKPAFSLNRWERAEQRPVGFQSLCRQIAASDSFPESVVFDRWIVVAFCKDNELVDGCK